MGAPRIAVVGGGPAGLAVAIEARRAGLEVAVFERRTGSLDKACGEGLMPAGVRALERLGAVEALESSRCAQLVGIRYRQGDGACAEGRFRHGTGRGIRRTALVQALRAAASRAGVELRDGAEVRSVEPGEHGVAFQTGGARERCGVLVAADGLASPLRRTLGLEAAAPRLRRFGLRRHIAGVVAGEWVEVHWTRGAECYLTPVGPEELGVAFLFSEGVPRFDALLARFPAVAERIAGGTFSSGERGAGPMGRQARSVAAGRVALVGDAAGYLDAITGEGLSLAFAQAAALAAQLPSWCDGDPAAPGRYARAHALIMRRHLATTAAVLCMSRWPALRARIVRQLARWPASFERALEVVLAP